MAIKILKAVRKDGEISFLVHTDTTKIIDGEPDPSFVIGLTWSSTPPAGVSEEDYLVALKAEAKQRAEEQAAAVANQTHEQTLEIEGEVIE